MKRRIRPPKFKNTKSTQQWFKNVGKSLGYVYTGTLVNLAPGVTETFKGAKSVYDDYKDPVKAFLSKDTTMQKRLDMIMGEDTTYIDIAKDAAKNFKEDLKSGNFNNKARQDKAEFDAMGFGDFDFDVDMDFGDMDDSSFDEDIEEPKVVVKPNIKINSNINGDNPMVQAVQKQIETSITIAEADSKRDNAMAKANFGYMDAMNSNLITGLSTVNKNLNALIDFNNSVFARSITAQETFYETSLKFMEDMLTEVKKITTPKEKEKSSKGKRFDVNDIFMYGQSFDTGAYIERIKKNFKNSSGDLDAITGMLTPEFLKSMAANPIGLILENVMPGFVPVILSNTIKRFDDAITSFLPAFTKKMAGWATDTSEEGFLGFIKGTIGKYFGVVTERKQIVDLGSYNKEAIPFDGITKKAITEVIPGYLAKILSVVSKEEPLAYDYKYGKFKSVAKVEKDFYDDTRGSITSSYDFDVVNNLYDLIKGKYGNDSDMIDKVKDALVKLSETDKVVDYRRTDERGLSAIFNTDKKDNNPLIRSNEITQEQMDFVRDYFKGLNKSSLMKFFGAQQFDASQQYSNALQSLQDNDLERAAILFNGLYDKNPPPGSNPPGGGGGGNPPTPEQARLNFVIENLRQGRDIPAGYEDVVLDDEARRLLQQNQEKKNKKFKLFKSDNPVTRFIGPLLEKPMEFLNEQAGKLETVLHDIIFGPEDEQGEDNRSLFEKIKDRTTKFFTDIREKLFGEDGFFTKIKDSEWYKNLTNKLTGFRNKVSDKLFGVKDDITGIYSGGVISDGANKAKDYAKRGWDSAKKGWKDASKAFAGSLGYNSLGELGAGGLAYIRTGFMSLSDSLFGPRNDDGTLNEDDSRVKLKNFLKDNIGGAIGKGAVGAGLGLFASMSSTGLLSGLVLGPIGGAILGFAGSLLSKSETFMNFMFGGTDLETGQQIDGIISRKTQDFFRDNKKTLITSTAVGTGVGALGILPGFLLGGPVAGAIMGLAGGILYKSETFQNFMFGEDGAMTRFKSALSTKMPNIKNLVPSAVAGGLGGAGVLAILGLNPLLGAFAGAGLGIATKSEAWSKMMFGDPEDLNSNGVAGKVVGFIGDKVIDPITIGIKSLSNKVQDWFDKSIKLPIMNTVDYGIEGLKLLFTKLKDTSPGSFIITRLVEPVVNIFKGIGSGLYKFTTGLLKRSVGIVGKIMGKIISTPINIIEKLTTSVVKNFFKNSVIKEIRAPFENMVGEFKDNATQILTDFKDGMKDGFKEIKKTIKDALSERIGKLATGIGTIFGKVFGVRGQQFKAFMENRREAKKQKVLSRIDDIRAGRSSKGEGARTGFEKFRDYADTYNPFSSLRKYAGYGVYDENGTSILDKLGKRSAERREKAEKAKAERAAELGRLKESLKTDGFKEKFFKKNIKGYNKMSDAEKATVKATTEITANTSDIVNTSKGILDTLKEILNSIKHPSKKDSSGKTGNESTMPSVDIPALIDINENPNSGKTESSMPSIDVGPSTDENKRKGSKLKIAAQRLLYGKKSIKPKTGPDEAVKDENDEETSKVANGVSNGFSKLLTKGPLKKLGPLIGAMSKLLLPLAAKAALIGVGVLALVSFFRDPIGFIKKAFSFITDILGPLLKAGFELVVEAIGELNPIKGIAKGIKKLVVPTSSEEQINAIKSDIGSKKRNLSVGNLTPDQASTLTQVTGTDYTLDGVTKDSPTDDRKYAIEQFLSKSEDRKNEGSSNAIGASNISKNRTVNVHKNEGILTAQANHLFGGGATTSEILNEYARRGLNTKENISGSGVDKLLNIVGGTIGGSVYGTDEKTFKELKDYADKVNSESTNVTDSDYWNESSVPDKYGPLGKLIFKIARTASLPSKMVNETLDKTSIEMDTTNMEVETKTKSFTEKLGEAAGNLWGSIKNKFSNIFGGDTETGASTSSQDFIDAAQSNPDAINGMAKGKKWHNGSEIIATGGGEVKVGSSNYYTMSNKSSLSDVNPNRTILGKSSPHMGMDLLVKDRKNKFVKSTTKGTVVYVGRSQTYGNMVQVRDDRGMYHMYGHMSTILVSVGKTVYEGTVLGIEGSTGDSTGSHVHYEVGSGYIPGDHLTGRVHPGQYVNAYNGGSSVVTPIERYRTGSYGSGSSNYLRHLGPLSQQGAAEEAALSNGSEISTNAGTQMVGDGSGTASGTGEKKTLISVFSPLTEAASAISGALGEMLGTGSSSGSGMSSSGGYAGQAAVPPDGSRLGDFIKHLESGALGSRNISSGKGDAGGVSFGRYQLASKTGTLTNFWNRYFADKYPGLTPGGNEAFKKAWLAEVDADPEGFAGKEYQFMVDTHYKPLVAKSSNTKVINPDKHSRVAQEMAWSTAAQYGPNTSVWRDAIAGAGVTPDATPSELVNAIQNYKRDTVEEKFAGNSQDVRDGVKYRQDVTERNALLSIGDAPPMAIGGGELGYIDRFETSHVGGPESKTIISSDNRDIVKYLKLIVTSLSNIDTNTRETSTNVSKINTQSNSNNTPAKTNKTTSSRNSSIEIAEKRRKEKYGINYEIAKSIAKGL